MRKEKIKVYNKTTFGVRNIKREEKSKRLRLKLGKRIEQ